MHNYTTALSFACHLAFFRNSFVLTRTEFQRTLLYIHWKIGQIHGAAGFNCQPAGVQHASVLIDPHKLIWRGNRVQIALLAVVKVRIRLPNPCQHRDAQCQRVLGALECETFIHPGLAEITVHRVGLQ